MELSRSSIARTRLMIQARMSKCCPVTPSTSLVGSSSLGLSQGSSIHLSNSHGDPAVSVPHWPECQSRFAVHVSRCLGTNISKSIIWMMGLSSRPAERDTVGRRRVGYGSSPPQEWILDLCRLSHPAIQSARRGDQAVSLPELLTWMILAALTALQFYLLVTLPH